MGTSRVTTHVCLFVGVVCAVVLSASGPVLAVAKAKKVICSQINSSEELAEIRRKYGEKIMGQEEFWQARKDCSYCTLAFLEKVEPLAEPFRIDKRDMRGWVVLDGKQGFDWPSEIS